MKTEITPNGGEQGVFDFDQKPEAPGYEAGWRKDFEALGGRDSAGWMQDLCLYFDLQWNVKTGDVGPVRYFIAPLILDHPFDCREISAPESWNVPRVHAALEKVFGRLYGPAPIQSRRMVYRTADLTPAQEQAADRAKAKFSYADRVARSGKTTIAPGVRFQPAGFVWEHD